MLLEMRVADLGVIEEVSILLGPGLTAVTGETGAGKTLIVGAIELLLGGRADPSIVRPGSDEAVVEGRFLTGDDEVLVRRVVPRDGRSRAYLDGQLATAAALADLGSSLVDLHGQHAHQNLLAGPAQRAALDRFGGVDLAPLHDAVESLAAIDIELESVGGDERARAREIDLLRYQVAELDDAAIEDPDEDDRLAAEAAILADAGAHREAAGAALVLLDGDGPVSEALASALGHLVERPPFSDLADRLAGMGADLADLSASLRVLAETVEEDPARLDEVGERRRLLAEFRRKYGNSLVEVMDYHRDAAERLAGLLDHDARAAVLDAERVAAEAARVEAAGVVRDARRRAAPDLAARIESYLRELAMPTASIGVSVDGEAGDDVVILLAANSGAALLPLSKVASGGELARAMLAVRRVLTASPPTQVFDEVDAGIGGEVAHAVGASLAELATHSQVLVVTHLAQVAAYAHSQVTVTKRDDGEMTVATATVLGDDERVVELSRMLSGSPESGTAQDHAVELLAAASASREA